MIYGLSYRSSEFGKVYKKIKVVYEWNFQEKTRFINLYWVVVYGW